MIHSHLDSFPSHFTHDLADKMTQRALYTYQEPSYVYRELSGMYISDIFARFEGFLKTTPMNTPCIITIILEYMF
jgi:hypothetical protein